MFVPNVRVCQEADVEQVRQQGRTDGAVLRYQGAAHPLGYRDKQGTLWDC